MVYCIKINSKNVIKNAHILVAEYFVPNPDPENLTIVNHIDENKANPRADNLEWCDYEYNANHATRNSKISKRKSKPVCEYDMYGNLIRIWKKPDFACLYYPVSSRAIQSAAKINSKSNTSKSCYGRQWRYYEDTLGENIESISNKNILKYNKHAKHNIKVEQEYLFTPLKETKQEEYIRKINEILEAGNLKLYQINYLNDIKDYIESNK